MSRYLLDTNHAGQLVKNDPTLWYRLRSASGHEFCLSRPSTCELWFMILNSARVQENQAKLDKLLELLKVFELDAPACFEFGRIRLELKRQGTPIPQIDMQIAAIARVNDLTLLSADGHFGRVQGLRVENWL